MDTMETAEDVMEIIEMTTNESMRALTMGDSLEGAEVEAEIPKSPCMPRPKKDK